MAKKRNSRGFFSSITNVREWLALNEIMFYARLIKDAWKDLLHLGKRDKTIPTNETFEEAMLRLQISEEEISKRRKYFFYYFLIYGFVTIAAIIYWIHLLNSKSSFLALVVGFIISIMMLVYTAKEHYWYMQMKLRKLNCTYKDWLAFICGRVNK
jgi:intracellular multiplication protein IcmV